MYINYNSDITETEKGRLMAISDWSMNAHWNKGAY